MPELGAQGRLPNVTVRKISLCALMSFQSELMTDKKKPHNSNKIPMANLEG